MLAEGFQPNTIIYTTLLKGYCAVGDLRAAKGVLIRMAEGPIIGRPDSRTLNTFMRGCVRVGDVRAAQWAWKQLPAWKLQPEAPARCAMARLLSQALRLGKLRKMCTELAGPLSGASGAHDPSTKGTRNPCIFWERGRCERGLNCKFYHDSRWKQHDVAIHEWAARDLEIEIQVHLAHAAALLQRRKACRAALCRASALLSHEQLLDERDMKKLRRQELGREIGRISAYMAFHAPPPQGGGQAHALRAEERGASPGTLLSLEKYMSRSLLFSARLDGHALSSGCGEGHSKASVVSGLVQGLEQSFGLAQAERLHLCASGECKRRVKRCVSSSGRLRWKNIFDEELPVKMEICSGTGDWVAAQAKADVNTGNWVALELRHDRVYNIFSRMEDFVAKMNDGSLCVLPSPSALLWFESMQRVSRYTMVCPALKLGTYAMSSHTLIAFGKLEARAAIKPAHGASSSC
ncbi:MAG: hypothetical protein SGPRY_010265 [Prymnesium sp.]